MITPAAHYKLKQILKSWLWSEKKYTYWQGLDSLAAPFLYLNFNNIPLAYACFKKFIRRYLQGFFYRDNSVVIQGNSFKLVFSNSNIMLRILICVHAIIGICGSSTILSLETP